MQRCALARPGAAPRCPWQQQHQHQQKGRRAALQRRAPCAVPPSGQQQQGSAAADPPPAIDVELFETLGADVPPLEEMGVGAPPSPLAPPLEPPAAGQLGTLLTSIDWSAPPAFDGEEKGESYDPLRDGPLRYLGYANELGEAFAAWLFPGGGCGLGGGGGGARRDAEGCTSPHRLRTPTPLHLTRPPRGAPLLRRCNLLRPV